jgi:RNA polymerase sigma factor for flagellar operon FliA
VSSDVVEVSEDEDALWRALKMENSRAARESLFSLHAKFARSIAKRIYRDRSWGDLELADLYQHAYTGLLESFDRFDPKRGSPFRAFAALRIAGSIRDGICSANEMREQIGWRNRIQRERMRSLKPVRSKNAGASAIEQLAELAAGLALGLMLEGTGLLMDENTDPSAQATAYDSVAWKESISRLDREVAALPEREQAILRYHYLQDMNFDQLAALLNISKGRVSQLHRSALLALRKRLRAQDHFQITR